MERRTVHKQDTHLLRLSLKNDLSSSHFDAIHLGTVVPFCLKSELSTFFLHMSYRTLLLSETDVL